jgi:DNA-binding SARP family transcriptional activator
MEFRILGPLEVEADGRALALGAPKQRALLAALLLAPNRAVSVDRLVDVLWLDDPPAGAANALQYHVSQLRKLLGEAVLTQEPGYLLRVEPEHVDALRFERLIADGKPADALRLWRGDPLTELADDAVAQAEARRLEALRLSALELRIEAELALGRHAKLVPELEALVRTHPLHERLSGALMRALYGAGRQADALDVYRTTRQTFIDELGIEPSPALRELERAILQQDPELGPLGRADRSILVLCGDDELLAIAEPLAKRPPRELILVSFADDPATATAALVPQRDALSARGVTCRIASYTTEAAGAEAALLAAEHDVDLVLAEAADETAVATLLEQAPCDVGLLAGPRGATHGPIVTPFGGAEHDWSAIELAAWLAASLGTSLRLLGTQADPGLGRRDASRLLARASLLVQQVVGIVTEPILIPPGDAGVVAASADARLLVIGLSERWRDEGIGAVRSAVAATAHAPVLFVRAGARPGSVAPSQTMTRFAWTVGST